ncbi:glycosyltransferase [Microbacterium algeriense]|uniref:glycosyltransferase n=1 Tax=Microbacterium algeriense TaxID=2615184 RepID=UPI0005900097|nr:glycosyltransferase [Microbacterium barkeri]
MPPTWSFITVTYNSARTLRRFWERERPADVEWIVVDNGSTDESVTTAESLGARVIRIGGNIGFSAANNRGLEVAEGRYIGFANPDVAVDWATLSDLQKTIDETRGLVSPQLLNSDGSLQPNGRGAPLLAHKVLNRLSRQPRKNGYQVLAAAGERRDVFWLIGAVILGSADTLRSLGGWNERFFLYYEDKDICIRAWRNELSVTLDGRARWTHGWARETTTFKIMPWVREFRSMATFYSLYPELLFGGRAVSRKHPRAAMASGRLSASSG